MKDELLRWGRGRLNDGVARQIPRKITRVPQPLCTPDLQFKTIVHWSHPWELFRIGFLRLEGRSGALMASSLAAVSQCLGPHLTRGC